MSKFRLHKYVFANPAAVPLGDANLGVDDYDEIMRACGLDPEDEEYTTAILQEDWEGHPAGSDVIVGLTVTGHPFWVIERR